MIKTLAKSIRQYTGKTVATPLVMIGEALMEILIPYVMSLLLAVIEGTNNSEHSDWLQKIVEGITSTTIGQVCWYGLIMFIMAILSLACGVIGGKLASEASAGFVANPPLL